MSKLPLENSFLQSKDWASFQEKLGRPSFLIEIAEVKVRIIKYPLKFLGNYLYAPRVAIKDLDELSILVNKVKKVAQKERSIFFRIEPQATISLTPYGFMKVNSQQPDMTLVADLSQSQEKIFQNMDHDTRYAVRTAEKRGVTTVSSKKIGKEAAFQEFWKMFLETNERQGISHYGENYYKELLALNNQEGNRIETEIILAKLEDAYIAGAILLHYENTTIYLYAASSSGYGRYNAPSYIIWRAISDAKDRGMSYFDFWGISDKDNEKHTKWAKFSAFKRSFGGQEVHYPGTFDLPLNRSLYRIYQVAKKIIH